MSELIAVEEREFAMPRFLSAVGETISFYFQSIKLHFSPLLVFAGSRLQVEGTFGGDIRDFQERFNLFGRRYGIFAPTHGEYDSQTRQAVARFQRVALYVLEADGFVGPVTARALRIKLLEA